MAAKLQKVPPSEFKKSPLNTRFVTKSNRRVRKEISGEEVRKAVAKFREDGGNIHKLPDERSPSGSRTSSKHRDAYEDIYGMSYGR